MMNIAPLNSSISVNFRLSVMLTPQRSYLMLATMMILSGHKHFKGIVPVVGSKADTHR